MGFIGNKPTPVPLTSSDIAADVITSAKIADDAISEEHLDATAITGLTALGGTPADTDELLVSDAGTLKRVDFSHLKGGGAYTKLLTTSISSATSEVVFNSTYITSTYNDYMVIISDLKSASENSLDLQFSDDNGSSLKNDYDFVLRGYGSDGSTRTTRATSGGTAINLTKSLRAQSQANAWIELHLNGLTDTAQSSQATWLCGHEDNSSAAVILKGMGYDPETTATNYIKIAMSSGNIELGKFTLYGRLV